MPYIKTSILDVPQLYKNDFKGFKLQLTATRRAFAHSRI
jgi:hypothetical protein